jgi:hypothetical protein
VIIRYGPYIAVNDRRVKVKLLQIAQLFQFLDRGFAEYFQSVVSSFGKDYAKELLLDARKTIGKMQNRQSDSAAVDLGDLGHFCEQVSQSWTQTSTDAQDPKFILTHRRDEEIIHYLQDALELPYWEFMLDLFLVWRANSTSLSGEILLRVLYSIKLDLLDGQRALLDEIVASKVDDEESLAPVMEGIRARMKILDSVWDHTTFSLDRTHNITVASLATSLATSTVTAEKSPSQVKEETKGSETVRRSPDHKARLTSCSSKPRR